MRQINDPRPQVVMTHLFLQCEISLPALKAAVDFVDVCMQHAAYLGGRRDILEEVEHLHQIQLGNEIHDC